MRKFSLVAGCLGTLTIAGCSSNAVSPTYLEDGTEAFMANCSGAGRTWANCEFEAGEECGKRGFEVIAKTSEPYSMGSSKGGLYGGPGIATQQTVVMGSSNSYAESSSARYLTFTCRGVEEPTIADKLLEQSKETGMELFEKGKEASKDLIEYIDEKL
jgi:hypothetical protein